MSFQTGLSGLNAASRSLDVIGHNIANANTVGMKAQRAEFADIVASSLGAGGGGSAGIGVAVETVSQQFSQGNINITGNSLDVAINGGGFLQLQLPDGSAGYTRNGELKLDKLGNVVTNGGAFVKGYPLDPLTGTPTSSTAGPLKLPTSAPIAAKATANMVAEFNLDAGARTWPAAALVPAAPPVAEVPAKIETPMTKYGTSMTVYDSQGVAIDMSFYLRKSGNDTWEMFTDPTDSTTATATIVATLTFGPDGGLLDTAPVAPTVPKVPPTTSPSVDFNITSLNPNIGTGGVFTVTANLAAVTQFGSAFAVSNLTQDGYAPGELTGLKIGTTGVISASYSNGQTQSAGQIALADFRNIQGLAPIGGNNWAETFESGQPVQGSPGQGKFGALRAGALEESNVDLTAELVNMMTAQRAYQANAQTIKTQDQVLSTLVNLR